ncbi:MAG: hypothetical protein ACWA44_06920 [Thiotrichales bacterium]
MDPIAVAIIAVVLIASQALMLHIIYNLHTNEQKLRKTVTVQGKEVLRLRKELNLMITKYRLLSTQMDEMREEFRLREKYGDNTEAENEIPNMELIMKYIENGATLGDLLKNTSIDESDAYLILNRLEKQVEAYG